MRSVANEDIRIENTLFLFFFWNCPEYRVLGFTFNNNRLAFYLYPMVISLHIKQHPPNVRYLANYFFGESMALNGMLTQFKIRKNFELCIEI